MTEKKKEQAIENIAQARMRYGYSQKEFAKVAGIHQTAVSHIELNRRRVSAAYAQALEKISDGNIKWISFFEGGTSKLAADYDISVYQGSLTEHYK